VNGEASLPQAFDDTKVLTPSETDVLCGRGAPINRHPGNIIFRKIVKYNKELYNVCDKEEKYYVAESVVLALEGQNPPARFLEARENSNGNESDQVWTIIPKERAIRKTIQALRERTHSREEAQNNVLTATSSRKKKRKSLTATSELGKEENEMWQKLMNHLMPNRGSGSSSPSTDSNASISDKRHDKSAKKQKVVRFDVALPTKLQNFHGAESNTEKPWKKQKIRLNDGVSPPVTKSTSSIEGDNSGHELEATTFKTSKKAKTCSMQIGANRFCASSREMLVGGTEEENRIDNQETPSIISESSAESERNPPATSPGPTLSDNFAKEDWEKSNIDFDDFIGRVTVEEGEGITSMPSSRALQAKSTPQVTPPRRVSTECGTPSAECGFSDYMKNWTGAEAGDDSIVAQDLVINDRDMGEKWFSNCAIVEDEESWILDDSPNLLEW